jgi:Xaa-Pro aminopeptidase
MPHDLTVYDQRLVKLRALMKTRSIDIAMIADPDALYYFCGLYNCLHMEFGRPTVLIVPSDDAVTLVTPQIEFEMAVEMTRIVAIHPWQDGVGSEWRGPLLAALGASHRVTIGMEGPSLTPVVRQAVETGKPGAQIADIADLLASIRRIKGPEEIALARHAGEVGGAMMAAARATIAVGIPEYEITLAAMAAGTRKAAELLEAHYAGSMMSPNIHFLQIMASGQDVTLTHHRASTRRVEYGDPIFLCFCGMTNFHQFKLGFDRTFWLGEIRNPVEADMYQVAVESQAAALAMIRPGVLAEDVHAAYAGVIQSAGFAFPFRAGRATGFSFLETPQLAEGDRTLLEENMVFAVDGSVQKPGVFRAQIGDSIVVTADGYEFLTNFAKTLDHVVVR